MTRSTTILALACSVLLLAACGGGSQGSAPAKGPATSAAAELSAELKSKLAAADQVDGTADHVVSLCSGCRLGMAGKAEHSISVEGYELHMCSESCKAHFEQDLVASLTELEIPES